MKIVVLGSGSWGTALANVLTDNNEDVIVWGRSEEEVDDINNNHHNSRYFDELINEKLKATTNFNVVKSADIILIATPSNTIESICKMINDTITKRVIVINVAKGFDINTHETLSNLIKNTIDDDKLEAIVSLIGPSHGEEVIKRLLTSVNSVSENEEASKIIQSLFSNSYFRVYTNNDVIGCEMGVALKNVIAIASGILEGLGQGVNARSALITRGLVEITRYATYFGAKKETFLGLCGVGDLIVTCTSRYSRNFEAGYIIGKDNSANNFLKNNTKTVEGINACKIAYDVSKKYNISMPITNEVYKILFEDKRPSDAIEELMNRDLKAE